MAKQVSDSNTVSIMVITADGKEYPIDDLPSMDAMSISDQRQRAFQQDADPLFFKWQRGEATEQEWLDKVQQIRERYPYPENNEGEK